MKRYITILLTCVILIACQEQKEEPSYLNISSSGEIVSGEGGSQEFLLSTTDSWVATARANWLSVSPSEGIAGDTKVTISVAENSDPENGRVGSVYISSGALRDSVVVFQYNGLGFLVDNREFEIGKDGGKLSIPIKANTTDYSVVVDKDSEDWILIERTKSLNHYSVVLQIAKNQHGKQREGCVSIKYKGHEEHISIRQAEGDELITTIKTFEIGSRGGEILIPVTTNRELFTEILSGNQWISVKEIMTKTMNDYNLVLSISPNTDYDERIGQVKIKTGNSVGDNVNYDGNESVITITQSQKDELIVTTTSYTIGSNGGNLRIPVKTNSKFTCEKMGNIPWLSCENNTNTKALESAYVNVKIEKNETYDSRIGQIRISGSGKESVVTITQSQLDELIVGETSFEIDNNGGIVSVPVETNVEYTPTILSGYTWMKIGTIPSKSLESKELLVEVSSNETFDERVGQIQIEGANKKSIITITQSQLDEMKVLSPLSTDVDFDGGKVSIKVSSNVEYTVRIMDQASSWISMRPNTKALSDTWNTFIVAENKTEQSRIGIIRFSGAGKDIDVTINQRGILSVVNKSKGALSKELSAYEGERVIRALKISGPLGLTDFVYIRENLRSLQYLDLTSADFSYVPDGAFEGTSVRQLFLPETIKFIGKRAFYSSSVTSLKIPDSVDSIAYQAFSRSKISKMTFGQKSKLRVIEQSAFEECMSLSSISFPKSLERIAENSFKGSAIASIAFENNSNLSAINLNQ